MTDTIILGFFKDCTDTDVLLFSGGKDVSTREVVYDTSPVASSDLGRLASPSALPVSRLNLFSSPASSPRGSEMRRAPPLSPWKVGRPTAGRTLYGEAGVVDRKEEEESRSSSNQMLGWSTTEADLQLYSTGSSSSSQDSGEDASESDLSSGYQAKKCRVCHEDLGMVC